MHSDSTISLSDLHIPPNASLNERFAKKVALISKMRVVNSLSFSLVETNFNPKISEQDQNRVQQLQPPPASLFSSALDYSGVLEVESESEVGENHSENLADDLSEEKDGEDFLAGLQKPLCLGAVMGLIPIRGLMEHKTGIQDFLWFHWRTFVSLIICFLIGCNVIFIGNGFAVFLTDTERQSAGQLVRTGSGVWFYAAGLAVYVFFLLRSKELCEYFYTWKIISHKIRDTMKPDLHIRRDVNLIAGIILGSCIGENIAYHFYSMQQNTKESLVHGTLSLSELLKDYYDSNGYMKAFFDYNPIIAMCLLITNKFTLMGWNYSDVILMLLSRAIYARFECFNLFLESKMVKDGSIRMIQRGSVSWKQIRDNFLLINKLLEEANRIFSPLIWLSYTTDIFFVCNQLYIQFSPNPSHAKSLTDNIYILWSFFHLLIRTLMVNMIAAKVNENAHRLSHILQHCYPEEYDNDVRRLEQYLASRVIGLSGNGCFVITRSFILMIISAIFTLEVVLLQNSQLVVA